MFKNRTVWSYVGLTSAVFAAATIVWGLVQPGFAHKTFNPLVIVFLALGIAAELAGLFLRFRVMPLIPVLFYSAALGIIGYDGGPIVMDLIHQINFLDGNGAAVIGYAVCTGLACTLAAVSCFFDQHNRERGFEIA